MKGFNKKYVLIDTTYINSGGGKVLLDILVKALWKTNIATYYFFDSRNNIKTINNYIENYKIISPSETERKKSYKDIIGNIESIICFGNIPPPIKVNIKVSIYFHNELLFNPLGVNLSFKEKIKLLVKKYYLLFNNNKNYHWICQTQNVATKLQNFFNISQQKIKVFPFYNTDISGVINKEPDMFIYPANFSKHKNHDRLFKAFIIAAKKINRKIKLYLTIDPILFKKSFYNKKNIPINLDFINIGIVSNKELIDYISRAEFLIFPSLNESFGLPLIEAALNNSYIIASNKDYVQEVVNPSLKFDATSIQDISESIVLACKKRGLEKPKLLVENKIDTFIEYIQ
jgi:glycosyltransferase involved in cell wall biosynthesis